MTKTAFTAPAHVQPGRPAPGNVSNNPDAAPCLAYGGMGLWDPRVPYNTLGPNGGAFGFAAGAPVMDFVPSTLSTTAIAAAQVPTANTPLTLVSSSGAGITVLAAATTLFPSLQVAPVGALVIDGTLPNQTKIGTNFITALYNPADMVGRNIQIASVGNDSAATFSVYGFDVFGYPMHETITGASGATATGKKAFSIVVSITPTGTLSGSNVSAGQGDTYGFPLYMPSSGYFWGLWNAATVIGAGTFTAGVTTTASATTGDVRGTYLVGSASNGTKRLTIFCAPSVAGLANSTSQATGLFGVPQF